MNIGIISLGCAKNTFDTEAAIANLITNGHNITNDFNEADIILINTCGFIKDARDEADENIDEIVQLKKKRPNLKLIVTGCYPQKFKNELLKSFPEIDAMCGIEMHKDIMGILNDLSNKNTTSKYNIKEISTKWVEPTNGRMLTTSPFSANIKISEGCNNRCSYCAIPSIRGDLRSRPMDLILSEAQNISNSGIKEITVIAQDTTAYGNDLGYTNGLSDLLYKLNDIEGYLEWIRIMYTYPTSINDSLIKAIKENSKVLPYIDVPLQHADNNVLKDMNRRGTKEEYLDTILKLREEIPKMALRTTFIVGYPTETEEAFSNLIDFVKKAEFDRAGFFTYSKEVNTPAYSLENKIPKEVIEERSNILSEVLQEISYKKNQSLIKSELDVLFEEADKEFVYGRSYRDAPDIDGFIKVKTNKDIVGKIKKVKITNAEIYDLEGKLIK